MKPLPCSDIVPPTCCCSKASRTSPVKMNGRISASHSKTSRFPPACRTRSPSSDVKRSWGFGRTSPFTWDPNTSYCYYSAPLLPGFSQARVFMVRDTIMMKMFASHGEGEIKRGRRRGGGGATGNLASLSPRRDRAERRGADLSVCRVRSLSVSHRPKHQLHLFSSSIQFYTLH